MEENGKVNSIRGYGESFKKAAVREPFEESGLKLEVT